jgi:pyruvate/2-oxoacid:ferredoxin oxidoreductase beta subunit
MNKTHNTLTPRYKCQGCGQYKAQDQFYQVRSSNSPDRSRASPYCIACNSGQVQLNRYRREVRTRGVEAMHDKINQAEHRIRLMLKALSEVQSNI